MLAGLAAGAVGAGVGVAISLAVPMTGKALAAGMAVIAASFAVVSFGVVAYLLDRGDLRTLAGRIRLPLWNRKGS